MISIINSIALNGLNGYLVQVQTDVSQGIPDFNIVGLPDMSVKESKERIKAAIRNSNINLKNRKIVINMAPASNKKMGTSFDLPITVGILAANDIINDVQLEKVAFFGELSLDGTLNKIDGVLPMCIEAVRLGIKTVFLPELNYIEASLVRNLNIIPVKSLINVINIINAGNLKQLKKITLDDEIRSKSEYDLDFEDVKGQNNVKRALEIASAGNHRNTYDRKPWSR